MQEILGTAKTVRELLSVKYTIDYYQRDYKWETKQVQELADDLTGAFLDDYRPEHPQSEVAKYGHYFLGSIILSKKGPVSYIVDGQQRLTSLTLLLIYLRQRLKQIDETSIIDPLILSVKFGKKSFNLDIDDRIPVMNALYDGKLFDESEQSESITTILARYQDIEIGFPEEINDKAIPYFVDWLIENVHLVEITAYSDDDAYTIFETMNDRGLSLTPTDMLKGYLLSNITDSDQRTAANSLWRERTAALRDLGKETEPDFFKAWLRSQYATTVSSKTKGAPAGDFDRLGTEFHRWVRDHANEKHDDNLVIETSDDFARFINHDFNFYAKTDRRLLNASTNLVPGWERVYYNAKQGFTLQYMMLLAPLTSEDNEPTIQTKVRLVALYLDILLTRRIWNYHRNTQASMHERIFNASKEVRGLDAQSLAEKLRDLFARDQQQAESRLSFSTVLEMHMQNRWSLHLILARLIDYVERESGIPPKYADYVGATGKNRYEVEHIWANMPDKFHDEFPEPLDFQRHRNRLGGLLLLPKKFNASFGASSYPVKLKHYHKENILAASLHPLTYEHNPGFEAFVKRSGLPFRPHPEFKRADLEERYQLYHEIAERIWNPDLVLQEVQA